MTRFPSGGKNFDDMFSRFDTIPPYHSVTDILPYHSQHYAWHGAVKIMYNKRNTVTFMRLERIGPFTTEHLEQQLPHNTNQSFNFGCELLEYRCLRGIERTSKEVNN